MQIKAAVFGLSFCVASAAVVVARQTQQTNPFANLCLFNYGGRLGLDNLAPLETYFNKNVPTAFTVSGFPATTVDITFDNKQQITKAVANDQYDDYFSTWQFYYK